MADYRQQTISGTGSLSLCPSCATVYSYESTSGEGEGAGTSTFACTENVNFSGVYSLAATLTDGTQIFSDPGCTVPWNGTPISPTFGNWYGFLPAPVATPIPPSIVWEVSSQGIISNPAICGGGPGPGPVTNYTFIDADLSQTYGSGFDACDNGQAQIGKIYVECTDPTVPCLPGDIVLPNPGDMVYSSDQGDPWVGGAGYIYVSEPGTGDDAYIQVLFSGEVVDSGTCNQ